MVLTDDFNRADANPIGGVWTTYFAPNNVQLLSNVANATSGQSGAYRNDYTFSDNQFSQAKITVGSSQLAGVMVRGKQMSGRTCYLWHLESNAGLARMYRQVSGAAFAQLGADYSITYGAGKVARLEVRGSILTPYYDGVALATRTDTNITSGAPGIFIYTASPNSCAIDDWVGGDLLGFPKPIVVGQATKRTSFY